MVLQLKNPKWAQNEPDQKAPPTSDHKKEPRTRVDPDRLLLNQLLVLARVAIDLVERQEKAEDRAWLDEAEIAALVLRDYGTQKSQGLRLEGALLSQEGIELYFESRHQDPTVLWSLILTRYKPGRSEPSPC